jgi:ankyrin repeat protein
MAAAQVGQNDVVRLLLDKGADVNAMTPSGWNSLMGAARRGHLEVVRTLLAHGADAAHADYRKQTAADLARIGGYPEVVALLTTATPAPAATTGTVRPASVDVKTPRASAASRPKPSGPRVTPRRTSVFGR